MPKKKKFMVVARSKKAALDGLDTSRGHRDFTKTSAMYVSDPSEAKEIDEKYGKKGTMDAYVVEDPQYERALNGESWDIKDGKVKTIHNYTFGSSRSYADAWEAFERRRNSRKRRRVAEEAEVENGEKEASGVCECSGEDSAEAGNQQGESGGNPGSLHEERKPLGKEGQP